MTKPVATPGRSALVIKSTGSWYALSDNGTGERVEARLGGRIRLQGRRSTNPIVVGDIVDYHFEQEAGSESAALITRIHERRNYIIRRSLNLSRESHIIAANIDQAFLVATVGMPRTSFEFIDRFLVTAEAYHIPVAIILNKSDLYTTPELEAGRGNFLHVYKLAGYEVLETAAATGQGVDALRRRLKGKISLLSGNSGVGKSTLSRAVDPTLTPRVGEISAYHQRGRHTTTFSEMYPLSAGGWLIDTPGIKGFGLVDLGNAEVGRYFPDLFTLAPQCAYYNCTHTHEPDCAVKDAVEEGRISDSRYISYLKLLEEDKKYR